MDYNGIIAATDSPAPKYTSMKHFKCLCWAVTSLIISGVFYSSMNANAKGQENLNWTTLSSPQYFVFDFHIPPDVMFDKIIKLSVSRN